MGPAHCGYGLDMSKRETSPKTLEQFRRDFAYGVRSTHDFDFTGDLDDEQFADFLEELFDTLSVATDTGEAAPVVDVAYRWQIVAYRDHLGDSNNFRHRHSDTPWATMSKPLSESRVALLTSSGHFMAGDDPKPLGIENMTQQEAEARITETMKEPPTLSVIPANTDFENIRVRHGGYPVSTALRDHQVVFPLRIMEDLAADGVIGEFADTAYSFVGAAAQGPIKKHLGPEWAAMLSDAEVDAVLLVPI